MGTFFNRNGPEDDVPLDAAVAWSRAEGGEPNPAYPDQHCTTGTTPSTTFVGRIAGDDVGHWEESGAERRAAAARRESSAS
ncbi:hypothetical protein BZB76_3677 [Actinomadura pelletieri DSM 43383]|uniref:Uncharacterized protein n=1 Tax=Actinomadura pelletieri DSM 43383 TaxID=1120940 RepID=A0A495QK79_9ACTN|nr:hypothetical protein [Actinomadura pelletieri]RKS72997.1 hypothetical protein BZB76_3677 [Actinomadura pelletieri DSM 43383]